MTRRDLLWIALAGTGCRRSAQPIARVFPHDVAGRHLAKLDGVPLDQVSHDIRRLGAREAARALYEGDGAIRLTLYDMTNRKSAYAALRLAHETEHSVPFYHDQYYGVAESEDAAHAALAAFSKAFEQHLAAR